MNKSNNHAYGLLKSQYISVLKKCAILNAMVAVAFAIPMTASADETVADRLTDRMGFHVGGDDPTLGANNLSLYVDSSSMLHVVANGGAETTALMPSSLYGDDIDGTESWILNYSDVTIGNSSVRSAFDNIHAQPSDIEAFFTSGGLVTNGAEMFSVGTSDALLKVENTAFSNISTSPDDDFAGMAKMGGVFESFSTADNTISNSKFNNNFVMAGNKALGGAVMVYNGEREVKTGTGTTTRIAADDYRAQLTSSNTEYTANHAGNLIYDIGSGVVSDVTDENLVGEGYYRYQDNKYGNEAKGGAIYNGGDFVSTSDSFEDNYVIGKNAMGGAIYNTNDNNEYGRTDQTFELTNGGGNNFNFNTAMAVSSSQTDEIWAAGGAVLNNGNFNTDITSNSVYYKNAAKTMAGNEEAIAIGGAVANLGTYYSGSETFNSNEAVSENGEAGGGAIFNGQIDDDANKLATLVAENITLSNNKATGGVGAYGGAVLNGWQGDLTISGDSKFENNQVVSSVEYSLGGGLENEGHMSLSDVLFSANNADGTTAAGGALVNASDEDVTNESEVLRSTFNDNTVTATKLGVGGAVAVMNEGAALKIQDSSFTGNQVLLNETGSTVAIEGWGGAVFNGNLDEDPYSSTSTLTIEAVNNDIYFSNNKVGYSESSSSANSEYFGGAIANTEDGKLTLNAAGNSIFFENNQAVDGKGGAIYNEGEFNINTSSTGRIVFSGNTASTGEAIFNEDGGTINIDMSGTSSIVLNQNQNVYNRGTINIEGNRANSAKVTNTLVAAAAYLTQSVNDSLATLELNSKLQGRGTYNIDDAQVNMKSNGYVDYEPVMNLSNNNINMDGGAILNLDYHDDLDGNDIDIGRGAVVNYMDSNSIRSVSLADTMKNQGLLNVAEGVISDIRINNLESNGGTINIDVDNPSLKADVIKVADNTVGTTNITFDELHTLQLKEDERIYFAQTASGLSLDTYGFTSDVDNGQYTILIGNEINGTDTLLRDWFFYRYMEPIVPDEPENLAYVDLPRAAVEQTRSILLQMGRTNNGGAHCECTYDECNNPYCRMTADGTAYRLWATPLYRWGSYDKPVETDFKIAGVDFGFDVQPNPQQLVGVFGSYRDGKYETNGKGKVLTAKQGSEIDMKSMLAGLYYRHYFGNTYLLGAVYGGKLDADIKADNNVTASTDGTDFGAQIEIGHDFQVTSRETLTPSIRATYDYIKFDDFKDNNGKQVDIEKADDIELEAGIKYEYRFNNQYERLTTAYIKPSIIQTIENGGAVTINGKKYDDTLKNETLGRIEVGADAELSDNISVGAFGNYTFGSDYSGWGVGGNVRVLW